MSETISVEATRWSVLVFLVVNCAETLGVGVVVFMTGAPRGARQHRLIHVK